MIDPSEIVNNLVGMLRDIPALVTEVGSDPARIYAYHDSYPKNISLTHALHQMASPSIMVVWQGTQPGAFGGVDVWKHQITLFLRAKEEATVGTAYYRLFRLIVKGVPVTAGITRAAMSTITTTSRPRRQRPAARPRPASAFGLFAS